MECFDKAADFLPDECFRLPPDLTVVLGSGWGDSLKKDNVLCRIGYADIPGMGATIVSAINSNYTLLVQGVVLVVAITFIIINIVVDMLYILIDPRIRTV